MEFEIQLAKQRGNTNYDWLDSRHSFSFGEYFESTKMGFGNLLVLNEDYIKPEHGFEMHQHENMEIITIVLEGILEHKDNLGNEGIIKAGQVQRMSAGTGIAHSEFNPSNKESVHLLQIWILPNRKGLTPGYEIKNFDLKENKLTKLVSCNLKDSALHINQEACISYCKLNNNKKITYQAHSEGIYILIIDGTLEILNNVLNEGDAISIIETKKIEIKSKNKARFVIIEV